MRNDNKRKKDCSEGEKSREQESDGERKIDGKGDASSSMNLPMKSTKVEGECFNCCSNVQVRGGDSNGKARTHEEERSRGMKNEKERKQTSIRQVKAGSPLRPL